MLRNSKGEQEPSLIMITGYMPNGEGVFSICIDNMGNLGKIVFNGIDKDTAKAILQNMSALGEAYLV